MIKALKCNKDDTDIPRSFPLPAFSDNMNGSIPISYKDFFLTLYS